MNKDNTERETYICDSDIIYYCYEHANKQTGTENTPAEMGLIDMDNVKL